jgi:lipoic acid synthetase
MSITASKHPEWLRIRAPDRTSLEKMKGLLDGLTLRTVCEEACCPNQGYCFSSGTATFLIMGNICTRNCSFCAIKKGQPLHLDNHEPQNIARAVHLLKLKHVVITSVTRDDLPDGGAEHFADTINAIRSLNSNVKIEVLIPDFNGSLKSLQTILKAGPDVINHNLETVPSLYSRIRPKAEYTRSLKLLQHVKQANGKIVTKSGLMLGLGEDKSEVLRVMRDLREVQCNSITIGQYLPPSKSHYRLDRYVELREFEEYGLRAKELGFSAVASGPLIRSSYDASTHYKVAMAASDVDSQVE